MKISFIRVFGQCTLLKDCLEAEQEEREQGLFLAELNKDKAERIDGIRSERRAEDI